MTSAVAEVELYNLESDIREQSNVAEKNPEIVEQLMAWIESAREDLGDYDRIGTGARFFDEGPRRTESKKWIAHGLPPK